MRPPDADELLRRLSRGVRPVGVSHAPRSATDGPDFTSLLSAARTGAIVSGRRVEIPAQVGIELTRDQRDDLDRAADAAETAGARTLAAIVGRSALLVDVASRRATDARALRVAHEGNAALIDGVDAVVVLTRADEGDETTDAPARTLAPGLRASPATRIANASLLRSLADAPSTGAHLGE